MKKVLITGVTGQDGSLMADYLLSNTDNCIIAGVRRLSVNNHQNIKHLKNNGRFKLVDLDVTDSHNTERVIAQEKPDYVINFAANSFVGNSWDMPLNHFQTNCLPVLYQLEAIRKHVPHCRYYNAGSSEEFGNVSYCPQDEKHPLKPRSPYGASKVSARMLVKVYRESYDLYALQGWLFNHEGVRRGEEFVSRKITKNVARIHSEIKNCRAVTPLKLGNLNAKRDWSDAEDFMDGIWKMLNQEYFVQSLHQIVQENLAPLGYAMFADDVRPMVDVIPRTKLLAPKIKEYVLSSNETHTIREFVELAFKNVGIEGCWEGKELKERFLTNDSYLFTGGPIVLVEIDEAFYRPCEVELLYGDSTAARNELNWMPQSSFEDLVKKMVDNDVNECYKHS